MAGRARSTCSASAARRGSRNTQRCRRWPRAGCRVTKPGRGTDWPLPKASPPEIVGKLNAQAQRIFDDPTFRDKFLTPNFIFPIVSSPEAFAERIRRESEKWGKVIRDANVRVE